MGLRIAISASDNLVKQFAVFANSLNTIIQEITILDAHGRSDSELRDLIDDFPVKTSALAKAEWKNIDLYIFAGEISEMQSLAEATAHGVFVIDASGWSATLDQVPVVLPRIDEVDLEEVAEKRMVALPHPQVSQLMYILDYIRRHQDLLYVSVTNLLPVDYIDDNEQTYSNQLMSETRDFFNFRQGDPDSTRLAFNVNSLEDVSAKRSMDLSAQIKRLMPQIDTIAVHNVIVPVFANVMQKVTVSLSVGNSLSDSMINDWLGLVKDFTGVNYQVAKSTPRSFSELEDNCLLQLSNILGFDGSLSWTTVTDNVQLVLFQLVELINLLLKEEILED